MAWAKWGFTAKRSVLRIWQLHYLCFGDFTLPWIAAWSHWLLGLVFCLCLTHNETVCIFWGCSTIKTKVCYAGWQRFHRPRFLTETVCASQTQPEQESIFEGLLALQSRSSGSDSPPRHARGSGINLNGDSKALFRNIQPFTWSCFNQSTVRNR